MQRHVEAGTAGVALTSGPATQLVVNAPRLVSLRADDVQAAALRNAVTEDDVRTAAGHVCSDRYRARLARLGYDGGFFLVVACVEHLVFDAAALQYLAEALALLNGGGADEDWAPGSVQILDLVRDRLVLRLLGLEDAVRVVGSDHCAIRGDLHYIHVVDLAELLRLRRRSAGHARELLVHAEVVLDGDSCQRLCLTLDLQPLLRFDGLVQPLGVAAAVHAAPGEFVNDDNLAVHDLVFAVGEVERLRLERVVEIVGGIEKLRVVEGLVPWDAQQLLGAADPIFVKVYGAVLDINRVVPALLELRGDPGIVVVDLSVLLRLSADNERRAGLVYQDVVHLVNNRVVELALHLLREVSHHVVAKIVEAELVVRAVRNVGGVCLSARRGPQHRQVFVLHFRIKQVGGLVLETSDGQAEVVEYLAHPATVAPGQVVVHGYDVDALALQGVQVRGERGDERLALTGLHLRDVALVQHNAAHDLHVELPLAEGAQGSLANERERFRQDVVELLALLHLLAQLLGVLPHLDVGEGLYLLFQPVCLVNQGLQLLRGARARLSPELGHDA